MCSATPTRRTCTSAAIRSLCNSDPLGRVLAGCSDSARLFARLSSDAGTFGAAPGLGSRQRLVLGFGGSATCLAALLTKAPIQRSRGGGSGVLVWCFALVGRKGVLQAKKFLKTLPEKSRTQFGDIYPKADPAALGLGPPDIGADHSGCLPQHRLGCHGPSLPPIA